MVKSEIDLEEILNNPFYQKNHQLIEEPPKDYPTDFELYDPEEDIFEANAYLFGNNLGEGTTFGITFTYSGRIILLDSLRGSDRDKVLQHEKHHKNNPADSEFMTRKKTFTEEFYPNPAVSPVCSY